jgi:hypothetical protein
MSLQRRTLMETTTAMSPEAVLEGARRWFARRPTIYAAFVEQQGTGFITLRGQGGEEIAIAANLQDDATRVTGSSYMFDAQVSRFFATLPPAPTAVVAGAA